MNPRPGPGPATGFGLAHAKAILFGEHSVVHGTSAVALPIHGLRVRADVAATGEGVHVTSQLHTGEATTAPLHVRPLLTAVDCALETFCDDLPGLDVHITSDVPHGRGLGSSAAVAAAVGRAVADLAGQNPDPEVLHGIVQAAERVAHGSPSGLDARAVVSHDVIAFRGGGFAPLPVGRALTFVVADSGVSGSTGTAVAGVRHRLETRPEVALPVIEALGGLAEAAVGCLASGDVTRLGAQMYEAHQLLDTLGVSTPHLDVLVAAARAAGAPGAKLTGGGLGGCVLVLAPEQSAADELATALRAAGAARTWTTEVFAT